MSLRRSFLVAIPVALISLGGHHGSAFGQTGQVVVTVTSVDDKPLRFRGAIMFGEGGLEMVDGETPFEVRGRGGVALGMFERVGEGSEIRVSLSAGQGSASGTAGRVIVGHEVVRGVTAFARTF